MTTPSEDKLRRAAEDAGYLLSRGYPPPAVSTLIADHLALSATERMLLEALSRLRAHYTHHIARELELEDVARRPLRVDTASAVATLQAALRGERLLESPAGVVVDPSWQRSTPASLDARALELLATEIERGRASVVRWIVARDCPDLEMLQSWVEKRSSKKRPMEVRAVDDVAGRLAGAAQLVSADPELLDACTSWVNIVGLAARAAGAQPLCLE